MFIIITLLLILNMKQYNGIDIKERCTTCRKFVDNFHKSMVETSKDHFGGGDTAWEESRLGSFARSETRLLEILEKSCETKESSCHALVEEHEEEIENLWFNKKSKMSELENFLCIDNARVCCPTGKFGKNCEDCPGGSTNICFGRGRCDGNGTRDGDGSCDCNKKYKGDNCDECSDGYFDAHGNITCHKCHDSCLLSCTDATPKGCDECKEGYEDDPEEGCKDKDECEDANICEEGKFCLNKVGSHKCELCDPACAKGCNGTGRLRCFECNEGWKALDTGFGCEDIDECEDKDICDKAKTYCVNTEGSYKCDPCNVACSGGCDDEQPSSCVECAGGYKSSDEGCVDVNECEEKNLTCVFGETCVNKPGPDACEPCHESCAGCVTPEPSGCVLCKAGYQLEDGRCNDINECASNPCKLNGEECHNKPGTFTCTCKRGWRRKTKTGGICVKKVRIETIKKKEPEIENKEPEIEEFEETAEKNDDKEEL